MNMNPTKAKLTSTILKIYKIRKVPQFLFYDGINPNSMIATRKAILDFKKSNTESKEIDFIIQSGGGIPADAYRIIRTLRNNFEIVNIIVPFWAKSAATLLSLGGTNIIMDEFGEFGPLDIQINKEKDDSPQLESESALNDEYSLRRIEARAQELYYNMFTNLYNSNEVKINKNELSEQLLNYLSKFYQPILSQINPYNLGRKKRMLDIGEHYANRILVMYNQSLTEDKRLKLIDYLVNRCPDHGYVIDYSLISLFLDNVVKSSQINPEYEGELRNLASELLSLQSISFIGFINPPTNTEQPQIPDVTQNTSSKSSKDLGKTLPRKRKKRTKVATK